MALTKQDIWNAADELDAEGTRPTLQAVRKRLGRGSFTTIQDAMQEWKSNRTTSDAPTAEALPEAVSEEIERAGTVIWQAAMTAAHNRLEDERRQLTIERKKLEARATEVSGLADNLTKENDELRQELEALKHQAAEAATRQASEVADLHQEVTTARERAAHLEGQVSALKEQFEALTIAKSEVEKSTATPPVPGKTTRKPASATRQ